MPAEIPGFVEKMVMDIKTYKVRSATTIALACFETLEEYIDQYDVNGKTALQIFDDYEEVAKQLVFARATEPMARNGLKYVLTKVKTSMGNEKNLEKVKDALKKASNEYFELIKSSKQKVIEHGVRILKDYDMFLTHCNSTTATSILIELGKNNKDLKVVVGETAPRRNGRITAKKLDQAGIDEYLVSDTASPHFIVSGEQGISAQVVILGADEITAKGDGINQIGSLAVALAANTAKKPVFIVTPSLKFGPETIYREPEIEQRDEREVWKDAPTGIEIFNPVFERVPKEYITGYITEFGLLTPEQVTEKVLKEYEWLV